MLSRLACAFSCGAALGSRLAAWFLPLVAMLPLAGCSLGSVGVLGDAARAEFMDGFSPATRQRQQSMHSMSYAQLTVRWTDRREMIYLLAERDAGSGTMKWIGPGGAMLRISGPFILSATGIRDSIDGTEVLQSGTLASMVLPAQPQPSVLAGSSPTASILRIDGIFAEAGLERLTLRGEITRRQRVFYTSLAFTGWVDEVTERIEVLETRQKLRRVYWIEPSHQRMLRLRGDLSPALRDVLMEWTRVPADGPPPPPPPQGETAG